MHLIEAKKGKLLCLSNGGSAPRFKQAGDARRRRMKLWPVKRIKNQVEYWWPLSQPQQAARYCV